ncbi:MAG: 16S rRNA (guanine(527)-N(7))-methyltransferase RsmG [Limimaricola sp.]|uniref:16S rRNA (guanine(527)-N(7))-methyltransferase RsmG n=1 Tax=Limimaricola sp. TaxID=2211665 RepID=UPI001D832BAB|nr:16S rRNA (guanine(527)-N(7))-methyltransferase RsmG [Limimaricola sp.]MBI1417217.1 16S rRNA (guanine(527)-N(7))-methyltransferase RsmG [Limimaricola sp.]
MTLPSQVGGIDVSRETLDRLYAYEALIRKWTRQINLVSPATLQDLWQRHIVDSAQLFALRPNEGARWADIGSGAGLPGIVLAILAKEHAQDVHVTLVESDQRKSVFLRTAIRELALDATVFAERIEAVAPMNADLLTARALSPLTQLLVHAERHLSPRGVALFPKGRAAAQEIAAAEANWRFRLEEYPSMTEADSRILRLTGLTRG